MNLIIQLTGMKRRGLQGSEFVPEAEGMINGLIG